MDNVIKQQEDVNVLEDSMELFARYLIFLLSFPPGVPECINSTECDDSDPCTQDVCDTNGLCQNPTLVCDDFNACTLDFCNASGCQNIPNVLCDDGNGCTDEYCNATDGQCYYTTQNCSNFTDVCNIGYCDPIAPKPDNCFQRSVVCPRKNNCTIAFCEVNRSGCTNQTLDCSGGILSAVIGITAGVLAAIIVAAIIACAGLAGGGAYAVANTVNEDATSEVLNNPLFQGKGAEGSNPLYGV